MAFKHTITINYKTDAGTVSSTVLTREADSENGLQTVVEAGATNFHRAFVATKAYIASMVIKATKACTVKTNSTGGTDVFDLDDNGSIVWNDSESAACPITADITGGFYFDGGAERSAITISFLIDQPGVGS